MSSPDISTPVTSDPATSTPATPTPATSTAVNSAPAMSNPMDRTPEKTVSPNASFNEQFGVEVVKMSVGKGAEKQEFHIQKSLLRQKAPVFGLMFSGNFAEGRTGEATLPEDNPKAFAMFASWVYCSVVREGNHIPFDYIRLFILAEKYGIVTLADSSMDACVQQYIIHNKIPSMSIWQLVTGELMDTPNCGYFCQDNGHTLY